MIGVYFSGTGNSRYCLEYFLKEYGDSSEEAKASPEAYSIEDKEVIERIKSADEIAFSYPVQYSNLPKILRDFIIVHKELWNGKKVFVIATMGLFSGDGAGMLARLLHKYGASIIGGLHLKMPDSISDEKALKRSMEKNQKLIAAAEEKIKNAVSLWKSGKPTQEGLGIWYHLAGLFGQRLYFYRKTKHYTDKLKIKQEKCVGCGKCATLCPMGNILMENTVGTGGENGRIAVAGNQCTMCYRCISQCPKQAITLLGKEIVEQCYLEKYKR